MIYRDDLHSRLPSKVFPGCVTFIFIATYELVSKRKTLSEKFFSRSTDAHTKLTIAGNFGNRPNELQFIYNCKSFRFISIGLYGKRDRPLK